MSQHASTELAAQSPQQPESTLDLRQHLQSHELQLIQSALASCADNQRKAAALLGMPLRTFERRLRAARERRSAL
jgi:DNA-binding NtrC family response regulator